jgi:ribosomal protein L37E
MQTARTAAYTASNAFSAMPHHIMKTACETASTDSTEQHLLCPQCPDTSYHTQQLYCNSLCVLSYIEASMLRNIPDIASKCAIAVQVLTVESSICCACSEPAGAGRAGDGLPLLPPAGLFKWSFEGVNTSGELTFVFLLCTVCVVCVTCAV